MDIHELAKSFLPCHECALAASSGTVNMPSTAQVAATLDRLFALLYPGCHDSGNASHARCRSRVEELFAQIAEIVLYNSIFKRMEGNNAHFTTILKTAECIMKGFWKTFQFAVYSNTKSLEGTGCRMNITIAVICRNCIPYNFSESL